MSAQYNKGQLGHGDNKGVDQPKRVKALEQHRVVRVACGGYHTLVLTQDNQLFGFGSNQSGECGIGQSKDINKPTPIEIPARRKTNPLIADLMTEYEQPLVPLEELAKPNIKMITCGGKHSLVTTTDGDLYTFGCGQQGQLGHRTAKNVFKPRFVQDFDGKKIQLTAAGLHHSIVMTQAGDIYVCGSNRDGQLGLGDTETRTGFAHLKSLSDKNVYRIFAGGNHSWVLLDEIVPMRRTARPPSPLDGDKASKPKSSPQKEASTINLTNQALGKGQFHDTFDVQVKHQQIREQREKLSNKAVAKTTDDFIKKVIE